MLAPTPPAEWAPALRSAIVENEQNRHYRAAASTFRCLDVEAEFDGVGVDRTALM
jgi:hypothetical protein